MHNYGQNRLVFRKLQSVVSSVLIGVNDVRPCMLSDSWNTGASWNLTDLWGFLESHRSDIPLVTEELAWFVD